MANPEVPSDRSGLRKVALGVVLLILLGIAAPFAVVHYKTSVLKNNEMATAQLLRDYVKAQADYFLKHREYAQKFSDLGGEFSALPDIGTKGSDVHGYQYRIMRGESAAQGSQSYIDADGKMTRKHGLLAVPARYGFTGRDAFFVSGDEIWALDLGPQTEQAAAGANHLTVPQGAAKVP